MIDTVLEGMAKGPARRLAPEILAAGSVAYAELVYDLFEGQKDGLVCAFISARQGEGSSAACRGVAFGLACSAEARRRRIALIDGVSLLSGRPLSELTPMEGPSNAEPLGIWSWLATEGPTQTSEVLPPFALADSLVALRAKYDYVILDCPPTDSAGLAASLAASADKVVLVVREGGARRREILDARNALALRGAPLVGCVLLDRDLIPAGKPVF
jgi:hypothetical protein